ncbi:ras and EF-hand domain-containing protein homolog isoform X2 [Gigantopelta aegis]|uniref:ras and EF-hand domain-containing protein homolog isoform X2 n=1 Tax=Gigantopelta aegis TaxID=1735272 RepID=UPI001B88C65B|nr:ras and EF-hand domain-containing protein homolog isoform X2 [Gigantopelta aegis]
MTGDADLDVSRLIEILNLGGANTSLTRDQLAEVSGNLNISSDELDIIFDVLDHDNDGVITVEDLRTQLEDDSLSGSSQCSSTPKARKNVKRRTDLPFKPSDLSLLSEECQDQVCELYQKLHAAENPELLTQFENIILKVIEDVRQYQWDNERLEKSYKREKELHDQHLRSLEEEMDSQMQKVEERVRKEEQEKKELEMAELRKQLDNEIVTLQTNLKRMQSEGLDKFGKVAEEQMQELKKRLEDIQYENRQLKSELTDTQTNLALVRSELAAIKQNYNEKCRELELVKVSDMDYIREIDNLTKQLHLLHDANKKLHDTNDDLREALSNNIACHKRQLSTDSVTSGHSGHSPRSRRKGSVMSDYFDTTTGRHPMTRQASDMSCGSTLAEELEGMESDREMIQRNLLLHKQRLEEPEDMDSGHSTMRDFNELDTESECTSVSCEERTRRRHKKLKPGYLGEEDECESHDELDTDNEELTDADLFKMVQTKKLGSAGSRGSRGSLRSLPRDGSRSPKTGRKSMRRQLPTSPQDQLSCRINREPERMYKVVLAGDAAVGKSSLIMRLCKGKFVNNLSSTLGVDFQTKVIEVDGRIVALQLWDTAGQERFRSIAKSYFRRADGVLCLYDVTYERSFLNIRDWIEAIEDGAQKRIPIMFVGNKIDARQEMEQQGRRVVTYADGQRLAREFEGLFIETSAKDGTNILESVIELTRLLRTNEDLEVKTVGMQLQDMSEKRSSSCCSR